MRPRVRFLDDALIERILAEARVVLETIGVEVRDEATLAALEGLGLRIDREGRRACFTAERIDRALASAPSGFRLHDVLGNETHDLSGHRVHFTPGSSAIHVLDDETGRMRSPTTADYVRHVKLVSRLPNLAAQSTALVAQDVPEGIHDSYRLFLSLLFGEKPVVTGAFAIESFRVMRDLLLAVRGSGEELRARPLAIFSCCPTAPLEWGTTSIRNLLDCAALSIPIEIVPMPLAGFLAPVTLVGTLVQHTAEALSGLAIAQLAAPGTPVLWGGSSAIFDVRCETTPMGAAESMMLACATSEIGKSLGLPTQAYIGLSDAKQLDAQAGMETSMGAALASLAGINNVSGPGMLDFESCQSLEKLVLDDEIAGSVLRVTRGIEPKEDFPALPRFQELLHEGHLLVSRHTRCFLAEEQYLPGAVVDRDNRARWRAEGAKTLGERARAEVARHLDEYEPSRLGDDVKRELVRIMAAEASRFGMDELPDR